MDEEETDEPRSGVWRVWLGWILITPVVAWALARTFGLERGFPLVQLMAYTPYVLLASLLICLVVVLLRQWLPFLLGMVAVAALAIAVVPREMGGPDEVSGRESVKILSLNLLRSHADFRELLDLAEVRDVDVLLLQEYTPEGRAEIESLGVDKVFPHEVYATKEQAGGGAIYSRYSLTRVPAPLTGFRQPRALASPPGMIPFELMSVHPMAPAGPSTTKVWSREFGKLPQADDPGAPRVLAGDFNSTLDHVKLRDLISTGYRDAGDVIGRGLVTTWPSTLKWPLPVTLDHVLAEPPIGIVDYDVERIDGSDHRAVYTELVVPKR